ncbi:uncharacterized protein A1O9_00237 [Exophiala aquamarina CBS 119918]|uniref:Adhesin domain-containing protein n=1 Tax=Exophiala aquamarina CBS 119918 TaxID=1182545 RepID=A0A072Q320_9EURO|nr:uncharacterized protein A1O9_00237 [Exophiala aquamarina CBS 119918]KEF62265.1 hypothetical protein A1O9_00237 [Exophiala aquamarina CBS 119918]
MSTTINGYADEKALEPLPLPATTPVKRRQEHLSPFVRRLKIFLAFLAAFVLFDVFTHGPATTGVSRGCHRIKNHLGDFEQDGGHQHPFPPIDSWKPYKGTTHFELDPADAAGLTVKGSQAFGKVVFETSKLSDKVVIDLDIKTNKRDKHGAVSVKEEDGYLTVDTPIRGKLEIYASAKILIPSNIIGTFGIPAFEVNAPRHMVDYSDLPESLEIGEFSVRVAKGFVKPGPVHTNTTTLSIAEGALRGSLTQARYSTDINVAKGNVTIDIPSISSGAEGTSKVHLGDGYLKGSFAVYNSTNIDVAKGSIYISVDFKDAEPRAELTTRIAKGNARVYVNSIAAERLLKASHTSIAGDQLITYPSNFQGTVDARGIVGDITLEGKDLSVEKVLGGMVGRKGDSERNSVDVKAVKGALDILVGDE